MCLFQLIDELATVATASQTPAHSPFETSLLKSDVTIFESHLKAHAENIRGAVTKIFGSLPPSPPDANSLQERLSDLLKAEKTRIVELQRISSERDQVSQRLETAVERYMVAEKKLDRTKSAQVAKLEAQAVAKVESTVSSGGAKRETSGEPNGFSNASTEAVQNARKEADAAASKRLEQIEQLSQDNKLLIQRLSVAESKASNLTDEDYAHCDLFKAMKASHDDVVKKINDLEATNIQLREEAKQLHSERTSYREEIDKEISDSILAQEQDLSQRDSDLTRIRKNRDALEAELRVLQQSQADHKASSEQMQQLLEAREARIQALEGEVERLKSTAEAPGNVDAETDIDALKTRLKDLERDKSLLETEMRSMETAWRKAQTAASRKIQDTIAIEEKLSRLAQEKAKAEQKYFGQMKLNQNQMGELKNLRAANTTSAEIITRHKDDATTYKSAISAQDRGIAELKENLATIQHQLRESQSSVSNNKSTADRLASQISEVKKALDAKDGTLSSAAEARRTAEVEAEKLKVRLQASEKEIEGLKKRAAGEKPDGWEELRNIALCSVCRSRMKDTALKSCGHVFCEQCVDTRLEARMRKCPNCGKAFGAGEKMHVTL